MTEAQGKASMRKRILKEFRLDEISVCDVPAQEGAVMVLMKRAKPQGSEMEEVMFEQRVTEITKREACSRVEARRKARVEHPEEFEDYQAEGAISPPPVEKAATLPGAAKAKREFDRAVSELVSSAGISRTAATRRIRRECPDLYEALQMTGVA